MADNVDYTPGSGATIATDDVGGVHFQRVKLVDGTLDSSAAIPGSATDGLLVNLGANNDVAVSGSVTANAGTNLNTSALALETGGNLASVKTNTDPLVASGGGGYVRQDSTGTIAKETGGNLAGAATSLAIMDDWDSAGSDACSVAGDVAHDSPDAGEPVKIGAKAVSLGATPTAVAAADRTDLLASRAGILFVLGGHPNIVTFEAEYTSAQTNIAIVTVSTGTRIVVTQIQVLVSNATTATPGVRVGFGTASTPTTTGVVLTHGGIPGGGGVSRGDGGGIIGIGADDEDLRITCDAPTGGNLRVLVSYFTIAG
jgi:hypothetical protein